MPGAMPCLGRRSGSGKTDVFARASRDRRVRDVATEFRVDALVRRGHLLMPIVQTLHSLDEVVVSHDIWDLHCYESFTVQLRDGALL
ncbi:hypothetical protein DQ04_02311090 [Trypanosoma grayi]|uniref:hypothetical protein n=1 Tax=Trypanosoma grayi TaxID=71804 RepID=UPI0004F412D8|nr:hypothetical protein DQ04_02311090 [Trypanosoma grayi]KEG11757.1 hypothetical protein DQ04_02311090 [Trypanosoma grayi]